MSTVLLSGLYAILTLWITGFVITFRKQLTCMVGMMASMVLGMTIGLGMGTQLALWLPGQFFQATMTSMLIGGIVGVMIGIPISLMAVLDGLLSGIMGGMMGAMLMVMVPAPYIVNTVKIMSVLCSGIIFLLFIMLQGEIKTEFLKLKAVIFSKPIIMFSVIVLTLGLMQYIPSKVSMESNDKAITPEPSGHTHNNSVELPELSEKKEKELLIKAMEYAFKPSSIRIVAGEKIKITLENTGEVEHDFEIKGTNVHLHAAPGKQSNVTVSFDKAGYYQVICSLPGHKEAGMTASIQVAQP